MPCMLLAALLLFARLIAPSLAMERADPALQAICHTVPSDHLPAQGDGSDHRDCLLCPACHLVTQAALPAREGPAPPRPSAVAIGIGTASPPSIAPPSRVRSAAQPTGPPAASV